MHEEAELEDRPTQGNHAQLLPAARRLSMFLAVGHKHVVHSGAELYGMAIPIRLRRIIAS